MLRVEQCGAGAQYQHLGMRRRVAISLDPVAGGSEHATLGIDEHGADRRLAERTAAFSASASASAIRGVCDVIPVPAPDRLGDRDRPACRQAHEQPLLLGLGMNHFPDGELGGRAAIEPG